MQHTDLILLTRLIPPRPHRRFLARPRLRARLLEALDYRLTTVQAGTGYGKTTALASLRSERTLLLWYTLDESDRDVQQFLAYLIAAVRMQLPQAAEAPQALLAELATGSAVAPSQVLDALINALAARLATPTLLILDDYQAVADAPEVGALVERLITFAPADLHVVISSWQPVRFAGLAHWRGRGELLELDRRDLAFGAEETAELFRQNATSLRAEEVALLHDKTEGWPIVVQLVGQGLQSGAGMDVGALLTKNLGGPSAALFDFLARELLERQPREMVDFLRETAILRELTPAACDAVRRDPESGASAPLLKQLHAMGLFVVALGDEQYRYHHLFHDFLRAQTAADAAGNRERHRRAATFYAGQGEVASAIPHWLEAGEFNEAANAIAGIGEMLLQAGGLNRLADWIDALPPQILGERARLQALLGDVYRLRSHFDSALAWYSQAEKSWRARGDAAGTSRALRGQAMIYLDTVRAAQAETLLQEALRLADGTPDREARARLLLLMAENKLNLGKPVEAEALRSTAESLRSEAPDDDTLDARVKLRTGRLVEARQALEALAASEQRAARSDPHGAGGPPRAHRETVLLLSLVDALMGQKERAYALAQEGIALGARLQSPFITAVAWMRLGHALQLGAGAPSSPAGPSEPPTGGAALRPVGDDGAIGCYRSAIALGDSLAVRRTRAEAMWGLTRAHGYSGDLELAAACAAEGLEIAQDSGDVWLMALANLALGASYVLAGRSHEAQPVLGQALSAFRECSDSFGRAAARLWMAMVNLELARAAGAAGAAKEEQASASAGDESGAMSRFVTSAGELLALCEANGYDFLLTAPSLLGPPDERRMAPLLLEARARNIHSAYATRLLGTMGLAQLRLHPGYQLRVRTLGAFRVWRGAHEVEGKQWQRDKARQLFQLLLTERGPTLGSRSAATPGSPRRAAEEQPAGAPQLRAPLGGAWLQRAQIVERLWPELEPEAAVRDFKVALNALVHALEPEGGQASGARTFYFIEREGTAYRLRPEADIQLDAAEFEALCRCGLQGAQDERTLAALRGAVALYAGDYLPEALYDDWAAAERERLRMLYLRSADRLATALVELGQSDEALDLCQALLAHDSCWEHAYQLMITIYLRQGNRALARRVFARCAEVLRAELDVPPSDETVALLAAG